LKGGGRCVKRRVNSKPQTLCPRCTQQNEKEILKIMKNAVIYLVNKDVISLEEEKAEIERH
jgi:hypothetical protein